MKKKPRLGSIELRDEPLILERITQRDGLQMGSVSPGSRFHLGI